MSAGNQYQVGDYACIPACHGRQRFARCDSVADSATWTYISDVCPSALLTPKTPPASFAPVTTAMSPVPYDIPLSAIAPDFVERIAEAREPARNGKDVVTALASR
ncbi:MAG: hypothetical protein KDJ88_14975 [Bauldia sp.]|nr:hypothetical protein [Bauldia sp.]